MDLIRNREELCRAGRSALRRHVVDIANTGLLAVDPANALGAVVRREGDTLVADGRVYDLRRNVHILGAGKATLAMAAAVVDLLGEHLSGGLITVPEAHRRDLPGIRVLVGDHPVPGQRSARAGQEMLSYAREVTKGSLVLCLFTGGSSALVSVVPVNVPVNAKNFVHELLVGSGLDIVKMNTVRKHVSAIKGGRLAQLLDACEIVNLTVSDVAGDVLDAITDLSIQDTTTRHDAIEVLVVSGLWDRVDPTIRAHLESDHADSPRLDGRSIQTVIVASGRTAAEAMLSRAAHLDLRGELVSSDWGGDAGEFGRRLATLANTTNADVLVGCGGETTVRLDGWSSAGKGGPNQELAVVAGLALRDGRPSAMISLDTDGSDGASQYAGGIADDMTVDRWRSADVDAESLLASHETTLALETIDQAVLTGPTYTNVNDLFVVAVGT